MNDVVLKVDGHKTKLIIDGVEIKGIENIQIKKTPDSPVKIELSGAIYHELKIET